MTNPSEERPELIVALVCPLGARVDLLQTAIKSELESFGYQSELITLSGLLKNLECWTPESDTREKTRIQHSQRFAFRLRTLGGPESLARAALAAIRDRRRERTGYPDKPASACAFILRQLKRPEEVQLLRRVYGTSIVVVAGHASQETRIESLADQMAQKDGKSSGDGSFKTDASTLIYTDDREENPEDEEAKLGQNTRDTYPLADFFLDLSHGAADEARRFVQLLFGHPFHTPAVEEMAMHQAHATALRSSDERRQVGAVIVKRTLRSEGPPDASVVASGMNEVPRRQGGYYWPGNSPDARDQALRTNHPGDLREDRIKLDAVREIGARLKAGKWLGAEFAGLDEPQLAQKLLQLLKRTQFMAVSEFMRQVHAEMAAIVDAAMRGVAVRDTEMYVTTFPCHGCAKHIIAAGIRKVVYLEPYPKSRAEMLHKEDIALDPKHPNDNTDPRVQFVPFTGVAPRQFARLFSMVARGSKNGLPYEEWNKYRSVLPPLDIFANASVAYTRSEWEELQKLPKQYRWDSEAVRPSSSLE